MTVDLGRCSRLLAAIDPCCFLDLNVHLVVVCIKLFGCDMLSLVFEIRWAVPE